MTKIIVNDNLELVYVIGMGNQCFHQIVINPSTGQNYINLYSE